MYSSLASKYDDYLDSPKFDPISKHKELNLQNYSKDYLNEMKVI